MHSFKPETHPNKNIGFFYFSSSLPVKPVFPELTAVVLTVFKENIYPCTLSTAFILKI